MALRDIWRSQYFLLSKVELLLHMLPWRQRKILTFDHLPSFQDLQCTCLPDPNSTSSIFLLSGVTIKRALQKRSTEPNACESHQPISPSSGERPRMDHKTFNKLIPAWNVPCSFVSEQSKSKATFQSCTTRKLKNIWGISHWLACSFQGMMAGGKSLSLQERANTNGS